MKFFSKKEKTVKSKQPNNNEILLEDKWINVKTWGDDNSGYTLFINPARECAKIYRFEFSHWGYHDERYYDEDEEFINIEQAISMVYPDETVISNITKRMNKDYIKIIEQLKSRGEDTNGD